MEKNTELFPTWNRFTTMVLRLLRPLGKIQAGWELLLWAIIYGNSARQFEMKLDYIVGMGLKVPGWFVPHAFLIRHGEFVGWALAATSVIVASLEIRENIFPWKLWFFRLIPLFIYAWLVLTNYQVYIDNIQQIR